GAAAATAAVRTAQAGAKSAYPLYVDTTNRIAMGAIGDIRGSSDTTQFITCELTAYSYGAVNASCWGRDANSKSFSCSTTNSAMISAVQAISGDSFLDVSWDAQGNCTEISVEQASWASPKAP